MYWEEIPIKETIALGIKLPSKGCPALTYIIPLWPFEVNPWVPTLKIVPALSNSTFSIFTNSDSVGSLSWFGVIIWGVILYPDPWLIKFVTGWISSKPL